MRCFLAFLVLLVVSQSHADTLWPIPSDVHLLRGSPIRLHDKFAIICNSTSPVVADAIERYAKIIGVPLGNSSDIEQAMLSTLEIKVWSQSESLNWNTDYSYELQVEANSALISAATPYSVA
jgi:hypothetical protein